MTTEYSQLYYSPGLFSHTYIILPWNHLNHSSLPSILHIQRYLLSLGFPHTQFILIPQGLSHAAPRD